MYIPCRPVTAVWRASGGWKNCSTAMRCVAPGLRVGEGIPLPPLGSRQFDQNPHDLQGLYWRPHLADRRYCTKGIGLRYPQPPILYQGPILFQISQARRGYQWGSLPFALSHLTDSPKSIGLTCLDSLSELTGNSTVCVTLDAASLETFFFFSLLLTTSSYYYLPTAALPLSSLGPCLVFAF